MYEPTTADKSSRNRKSRHVRTYTSFRVHIGRVVKRVLQLFGKAVLSSDHRCLNHDCIPHESGGSLANEQNGRPQSEQRRGTTG